MRRYLIFFLFLILPSAAFLQDFKVIPMAPNLVESVFALGAGNMVIAIPEYTVSPEEALNLPSAGSYFAPDFEMISRLKPDLIVLQGRHEKLYLYAKKMNIPTLSLYMEDRASIKAGLLLLGERLDKDNEALALVSQIDSDLKALSLKYKREKKIRVLVVLGRIPATLSQIMSIGQGSYLTELLEVIGAENIFKDQKESYPTVSKEAILKRNPDIILEIIPENAGLTRERLLFEWRALKSVSAVSNERIRILGNTGILIPGPGIAETAAILAETIEDML